MISLRAGFMFFVIHVIDIIQLSVPLTYIPLHNQGLGDQIGPKWDKSGTFSQRQNVLKSDRKKSRICPISGQFDTLLCQIWHPGNKVDGSSEDKKLFWRQGWQIWVKTGLDRHEMRINLWLIEFSFSTLWLASHLNELKTSRIWKFRAKEV